MKDILILRNNMISLYKRHENVYNIIIKMILGIILYKGIFAMGSYNELFTPLFEGKLITIYFILMVALFVVFSLQFNLFALSFNLVLMYSSYVFLALALLLIFMTIFVFYVRLAERECLIILLTILAFKFNIVYLVPLVCGIFLTPTFIFPIMIGTYVWFLIKGLGEYIAFLGTETYAAMDMFDRIMDVLNNVVLASIASPEFIFISMMLILMGVVVYVIQLLDINYREIIGIVAGGIIGIVALFIITTIYGVEISFVFGTIMCVVSMLLAIFISFFDAIGDEKLSDRVKFTDDQYIYYVKVVPKLDGKNNE